MASLYDYMNSSAKKATAKSFSNPYAKYSKPSIKGPVYSGPNQNSSKAPSKSSSKKNDDKKKSSNKKSSSKSIPTVSNILSGGVFGSPSSSAETTNIPSAKLTPIKTRSGIGSDLFKGATNVIKGVVPGAYGISELFKNSGIDISNYLGIDKALASDSGLSNYVDDSGRVLGVSDQQKAYDYNNPSTPSAVLNRNQGPLNITPTSSTRTSNNNTSNDRNNDRKPSPVSNPYNVPQKTNALQNIIKSLIEYRPDNTPTQSNQGTVRRPVGMGEFSSGQFSNGAGGYNLGGGGSVMGGGGSDSGNPMDESLINQILGIKPAEASEMQTQSFLPAQNLMNSPQGYTGANSNEENAQLRMGNQGINPSGYDSGEQDYQPNVQRGGGVSQQYSQGSGGGQVPKFDNSGYKDAMKAQKKALDELIKSIKSQYAQSTKEGTTALDASKQQDLLKLSGLFNFGANQDPNSEQRIQYEGRTMNDYAGQLKDLLSKLSQAQNKDISGAKQGYQSSLADIMQQQAQARQAYEKQLADQENLMWERNYKMSNRGGSGSAGSITYMGNNAQGEPVYRNSKTGALQVGTGLTKGNNDLMSILSGIAGQGQQGGSWETDPQTGEKIWVTN